MDATRQSFFKGLEKNYPRLHKTVVKLVSPLNHDRVHGCRYIYPELAPHIAHHYESNVFLQLPYLLLSPAYRSLLRNLSLAFGHCAFATEISKTTSADLYRDKKWVPHGANESCVYSIISRCYHRKGAYEVLFVMYGVMKTISVAVMLISLDENGEIEEFEIDDHLTHIASGLQKEDVIRRFLGAFLKAITYNIDSLYSAKDNFCLAAIREPNFGHHQWNIFSSLIDLLYHVSECDSTVDSKRNNITLTFDPDTNYLAIDEIAQLFGLLTKSNDEYSFLKDGPLLPLDAPIPRHNCRSLCDRIFSKGTDEQECIIVIIKGFNPNYNQNQLEKILAEIILRHVVMFLLVEQDLDIVIDGVTRTSSCRPGGEGSTAFMRFLNDEIDMYRNLLMSLNRQYCSRIRSMIGLPVKKKYATYVHSRFSVSISAHSTLGLGLLAGKPVVDIINRSLIKYMVNPSCIYYYARDSDPNGLAFIDFDDSGSIEDIIQHIISGLSLYLQDNSSFQERYSITNRLNRP
jgi:hypothetical protein